MTVADQGVLVVSPAGNLGLSTKHALAAIPVFLLTARGEPEAHVANLGVTRAFRKPLDLQALLAALGDVLER